MPISPMPTPRTAGRTPSFLATTAAAPRVSAAAGPTISYQHTSRKWYTFWKEDVHAYQATARTQTVFADTADGREKARQLAARDGAQSVVATRGNQIVVLSGGTINAGGGTAFERVAGVFAGMSLTIDGVAATVLTSDNGAREIDASQVIVAVIDSGVDVNHPALKGRVLPGYNAIDGSNDVKDVQGHGTHVAGIIGASGDGAMTGVAPNVKILPIKALGGAGNQNETIARAIRYAVDHGAQVINMSFFMKPGAGYDDVIQALDYANAKGVVLVKSAGNTGKEGLTAPGEHPALITVGSVKQAHTTDAKRRAGYSSYGDRLDVMAPGDKVLSLAPGGGYKSMSGTSMAAPHVAGLVALIKAQHPTWTPDQVRAQLTGTAQDLGAQGRDKFFGAGLVTMVKALFA